MGKADEYIPQKLRNAVAKRDRGICHHCGERAASAAVSKRGVLQFFAPDGRVFHIDHVVPLSAGGRHSLDNLVLACAPCNLSKRRAVAANDPEVQSILQEFAT
jgi:5-methylcytosine-specific restriction endonuclease McrA